MSEKRILLKQHSNPGKAKKVYGSFSTPSIMSSLSEDDENSNVATTTTTTIHNNNHDTPPPQQPPPLYRPRILYISSFLWLTVVGGRFLAPFLEHEAGLTAPQIGVCLAIQQAAITATTSIGGAYADALEQRHPGHGRVYVVGLGVLVSTASFLLHGVQHVVPSSSGAAVVFSSVAWHALLQGIHGMAVSLVFPVLDGLTVDFLQHYADPTSSPSSSSQDYGKERLHGPLWWAVANLILSAVLDRVGFVVCYPLAVVAALGVGVTGHLYTQQQQQQQRRFLRNSSLPQDVNMASLCQPDASEEMVDETLEESSLERQSIWQLLGLLMSTGTCFLICLLFVSAGQAVVDNLVFLFFEALGSSWALMGLSVVIKIAFEVPVFYFGGPLLQNCGGPAGVLLFGCACYFGRVVAYTYIPQGELFMCLLLEPLHGITYGAVQVALVEFAATALPTGYEASGQGLVYLFREAGSVAGVYLGGWADGHLGPQTMFRLSALLVACGFALLGGSRMLLGRYNASLSRRTRLAMDENGPWSPSSTATTAVSEDTQDEVFQEGTAV